MAEKAQEAGPLNPDVQPVQVQDYERYARPINYGSAIGGLFKDVGEGIKEAAVGTDNALKEYINQSQKSQVDQIRDRATAQLQGDILDKTAPPGINQAIKGMAVMNQASKTGTITPAYYEMQLDSVSRSLRQQFPGYRDYIDQSMSAITHYGLPANKIISNLFHEQQARGAADPEVALQKHWLEKLGEVDETGWAFNYHAKNGAYPSNDAMAQRYSSIAGAHFRQKGEELGFTLNAASGKTNDRDAENGASNLYNFAIQKALTTNGSIYGDIDKIKQIQALSNAPGGHQMTFKEHQQVLQSTQAIVQKMDAVYDQTVNGSGYSNYLTPEIKQKLLKQHEDMKTVMLGPLGVNYEKKIFPDSLHTNDSLLKARSEYNQTDLLNAAPTVGVLAAMSKQLGPTFFNEVTMKSGGSDLWSNGLKEAIEYGKGKIITKGEPLDTTLQDPKIKSSPGAAKEVVEGTLRGLDYLTKNRPNDPNTQAAAQNIVEGIYKGGQNWLNNVGGPKEGMDVRYKAYNTLASPNVIRNMEQLHKDGKIDDDHFQAFSNWVTYNGGALARTAVTDAASSPGIANITYDQQTHRFTSNTQDKLKVMPSGDRAQAQLAADSAAFRLNAALAPIIQVQKAAGADDMAIHHQLINIFKAAGLPEGAVVGFRDGMIATHPTEGSMLYSRPHGWRPIPVPGEEGTKVPARSKDE